MATATVTNAFPAGRSGDAVALVFEYMAATQSEPSRGPTSSVDADIPAKMRGYPELARSVEIPRDGLSQLTWPITRSADIHWPDQMRPDTRDKPGHGPCAGVCPQRARHDLPLAVLPAASLRAAQGPGLSSVH
jgi:hypothetical protein